MSTDEKLRTWLRGDLLRRIEVTSHVNGVRVTFVEQYTTLTSGVGASLMDAVASVIPHLKGARFKRLQADQERLKNEVLTAMNLVDQARARLAAVEKDMRALQNDVIAGKDESP